MVQIVAPAAVVGSTVTVDPITRIEGHLSMKIDVQNGVVSNAWASGLLYRGFERILVGRDPMDAPTITSRICGVCHSTHRLCSIRALENARNATPPPNAIRIRNILEGMNFVYSHLAHIFLLAGPDYDLYGLVSGLSQGQNIDKYNSILKTVVFPAQRLCHEVSAVFGGKVPHHMTTVPGGASNPPTSTAISTAKAKIATIKSTANTYLPMVLSYLDANKSTLSAVGKGYGNFVSYGVFPDANDPNNTSKFLLKRGVYVNGASSMLDVAKIVESTKYSWYTDASGGAPASESPPTDRYGKAGAYSWIKSPRYGGQPCEAGPLARMAVSGLYPKQASLYDRLKARVNEAILVLGGVEKWVNELTLSGAVYTAYTKPANATGVGLWEAPRGANGHWVRIVNSKISGYQILPPTNWNASPRDSSGFMGPIEKSLIGTPTADIAKPTNALKVVRSFDPCVACAVH